MTFVVAHNFTGVAGIRRLLVNRLRAWLTLTPQERANHYVSRMPIAVVTASLGGHPADLAD